jgi:glycosyltransferase involved in cell wall biosynthesis
MRTLFLCSRILAEIRSGTDLRVQGQISALVQIGPTAVFSVEYSDAQPIPGVEVWGSGDPDQVTANFRNTDFISDLVSGNKGPYDHRYSERTASKLRKTVKEFQPDLIVISKLEQTVYLEVLGGNCKARIILDLDESSQQILKSTTPIMTNRAMRILNTKIFEIICEYESKILPRFSQIWVSSEIEVERIKIQYGLDTPVVNIPNAVDFRNYSEFHGEKIVNRIIFPANFGHPPNDDAARYMTRDIIPIMKDFKFQFVGSAIPKWMLDLNMENVEVVSNVPSIAPSISKAAIMLIPLRAGAGTRLKALEAFASKTPVVSTQIGIEGLGVVDRKHVLIAETPEEFNKACQELISNPTLYKNLIESAFKFAETNFSHPALLNLMKKQILSLN